MSNCNVSLIPKFKKGDRCKFRQPYVEGTVPQFPIVTIYAVSAEFGREETHYLFKFDEEESVPFIWFPECMFTPA